MRSNLGPPAPMASPVMPNEKMPTCYGLLSNTAWWCSGGVGLAFERSRVRFPANALSGNDLGQVVHTNVPLFTKQYNLVPCKGFHANTQVMWLPCIGPMNKGSIVEAVLQ